jgi:Family of unknown function (DUF6279)
MITMSSAMRLPSFVRAPIIGGTRALRAWLAVFCLVLLTGCSLLRLTYPQLPTIVYWWLDGYVDFSITQSPRVQLELAEWLRWHRSTQLPEYAALLQRARSEVLADTTPAQVCRWVDEGVSRLLIAYEQGIAPAAETLLALTPAQLNHMERRFEKGNADFEDDFLQPSAEDRLKVSIKRTVERAQMLYGRLDDAQRERIAREVEASPFDPALWLAERKLRQREILATLRRLQAERAGSAQLQAALRVFAEQAQRSPRPAYRAYQLRLKRFNCEFAAQLHNATTPAQRQAAAETLKGWEIDLRTLAAEAPK